MNQQMTFNQNYNQGFRPAAEVNQSSSQLTEFITVTVFPCGKEDNSHLNDENEIPYEMKIFKKSKLYISNQH